MAFQYAMRVNDPHRVWVYEGSETEAEIFSVTGGVVDFEDHPEGGRRPAGAIWVGDERGSYGPVENGLLIVSRMNDGGVTTMTQAVFDGLWTTFTPNV